MGKTSCIVDTLTAFKRIAKNGLVPVEASTEDLLSFGCRASDVSLAHKVNNGEYYLELKDGSFVTFGK